MHNSMSVEWDNVQHQKLYSNMEDADPITNRMFKSKAPLESITSTRVGDNRLNYDKSLSNPQSLEYTYINALANLEQMNLEFKKRITDKNKHYNFFLDDSENPNSTFTISQQEYDKYLRKMKKGAMAYTVRNTWTKGKDFFYVKKGCLMKVVHIYQDRTFVDVEHKDRVGLMKLQELRMVFNQDEDSEDQ